jgi:hypothetical protein
MTKLVSPCDYRLKLTVDDKARARLVSNCEPGEGILQVRHE